MKKFFTIGALLCATWMNAQGVYQIPNSDFENWESDDEPGNGWNSFKSASTNGLSDFMAMFAKSAAPAPQKTDGYNSTTAIKLKSKKAAGTNANGNLTTGKINMGSITPKDAKNYNYTDLTSSSHSLQFAGTPDAVSCMAKFKSGGSPNGRGQFILHDEYEYKDPETSNDGDYESHKIASAVIEIPKETPDWTYFEKVFTYTGNVASAGKQYMLASFTTNPEPGGSAEDELIIDDVRLIYYSELASLSYDGTNYFKEGVTNYTVDAGYDESKLSCTSNGRGATIEKSYNEETAVLTITVKGNDVSVSPTNLHTYTVQFKKPVVTTYTNSLLVCAYGTYVEPTENSINLIKETDDSYSLEIKDFVFGAPIGDIKIVNLNREESGNVITYSAINQMVYVGGFINSDLPITVNAIQKEDKLTADIRIALNADDNVDVTFLPALTINGEDKLTASADRYNVTMNRTFPQGWSTICLPFATTPAALGAASVQELVSADENGLNFAEVETLEANKPYLIYFDAAKDAPIYFPAEITSTTPVAVTKGDYTFVGSYEASISMSGKYGVATIDGTQKITLGGANSTLKATRAYFTKAGEKLAQVRINLYTSATTGIDQMENNGAQVYDVYSLQGVQVLKGATSLEGLQKGIYIVNGKKMIIK